MQGLLVLLPCSGSCGSPPWTWQRLCLWQQLQTAAVTNTPAKLPSQWRHSLWIKRRIRLRTLCRLILCLRAESGQDIIHLHCVLVLLCQVRCTRPLEDLVRLPFHQGCFARVQGLSPMQRSGVLLDAFVVPTFACEDVHAHHLRSAEHLSGSDSQFAIRSTRSAARTPRFAAATAGLLPNSVIKRSARGFQHTNADCRQLAQELSETSPACTDLSMY